MTQELNTKKYDLMERTSAFGRSIIDFCRKVPPDIVTKPIVSQLIRSATSIGANYSEADEAISKKDFINKMAISKKEIKETKYWLQMIAHATPLSKGEADILYKECHELNLIFSSIINKTRS
jgi:four helix bundle protein